MCSPGTGQAALYCRVKRAGTAVREGCKGIAYKMLLEIDTAEFLEEKSNTTSDIHLHTSESRLTTPFFFLVDLPAQKTLLKFQLK